MPYAYVKQHKVQTLIFWPKKSIYIKMDLKVNITLISDFEEGIPNNVQYVDGWRNDQLLGIL